MTGDAAVATIEGSDFLPNPRQESFARLVANGATDGEAYTKAGYRSNTPAAHGARLAKSGSIAERIAFLRDQIAVAARAAATVDASRIQQELEALAFSDISQAFEETVDEESGTVIPRLLPITRWPQRFKAAVAKVKVKRYLEGPPDAQKEFEIMEFALWPKNNALAQLREHMGLVKPVDVNVRVTGIVALPVMQVPVPGPGDRIIDVDVDVTPDLTPAPIDPAADAARAAVLALLRQPSTRTGP